MRSVLRVLRDGSSCGFLSTCRSFNTFSSLSPLASGCVNYSSSRRVHRLGTNLYRPRWHRHVSTSVDPGPFLPNSTVYALSTAPGQAALAIIRCSGPRCRDIYAALCPGKPIPQPRVATLRTLYRPHPPPPPHLPPPQPSAQSTAAASPAEVLDPGALVLFFPGPHTVTGEDVLELHVHGGLAVVRAVLASIPTSVSCDEVASTTYHDPPHASIRYAEPGEFTRRAFANARLSLPQIEALSATLSAITDQQHRAAVAASAGAVALAARYESWRGHLVAARGELEALIDFAEDQHFDEHPASFLASVTRQVRALGERLRAHAEHAARSELLRDGVSVALVGAPNAGKSSLLNAVAGRAVAIVHAEPGTTRDVLDVAVDVDGYACRFGDLAGLRGGSDAGPQTSTGLGYVEREGIRRARARAQTAQVVIVVVPIDSGGQGVIEPEVRAVLAEIDPSRQRLLIALNKTDLLKDTMLAPNGTAALVQSIRNELPRVLRNTTPISLISSLSERQPSGIQPLLSELSSVCKDITSPLSDSASETENPDTTIEHAHDWDLGPPSSARLALGASERQRRLLEDARNYLDAFLEIAEPASSMASAAPAGGETESEVDIVLAAEHLRDAADCLGRVSGRGEAGDVEEVLGVVFEKFCVGK